MTYVIVGNGIASVGAIEGIRKYDRENPIIVVSEEKAPTYGRPLISYLLAGKIGPERMSLRPDDFYEKNNVELKLGAMVESLDTEARTITTSSGEAIPYDRLLIATGGVPFYPPIPGSKGKGVYSFTTIEHAEALLRLSRTAKKVVVIGGGLIGLKAAEGLFDQGVDVSIVELAPRVLSAAFDDAAGNLVSKRLQNEGLRIFCSANTREIVRDESGKITGVQLTNGTLIECEAVVMAIGVIPRLEIAKSGGIEVDRGIKVDDHLETSAEGVFAAGDVAQGYDMLACEERVVPIWPNAYQQGYYAGQNMAGKDIGFPGGLAMNAISFYGLATASLGTVNPPEDAGFEVVTQLDQVKDTYRKLVFKDDRLVGYVFVGDIDMAGLYTGFIRFKVDLSEEVKAQLIDGKPSALLWPEEVFNEQWTPGECAFPGA